MLFVDRMIRHPYFISPVGADSSCSPRHLWRSHYHAPTRNQHYTSCDNTTVTTYRAKKIPASEKRGKRKNTLPTVAGTGITECEGKMKYLLHSDHESPAFHHFSVFAHHSGHEGTAFLFHLEWIQIAKIIPNHSPFVKANRKLATGLTFCLTPCGFSRILCLHRSKTGGTAYGS
jgi:hypothetical protein